MELGLGAPEITLGVRTGDTPQSERQSMIRKPRTFVVTTPESLYLLVTAAKSRDILRSVETVIVDEIHAMARDKRGSHLAITLERLEHVCRRAPARVGLSATQKPIETVAKLLVGTRRDAEGSIDCAIVDGGHQRTLDLQLELPDNELEAVASHAQMDQVLDRIAELVAEHHTTLVFVNTRRLAERLAHQLGERLGEDVVAAHHGSLSKDRRHRLSGGCGRANSRRWLPLLRLSWASTSVRWSWSARSDLLAPSPPFSNGSGARTTPATAPRAAGSIRLPAMS